MRYYTHINIDNYSVPRIIKYDTKNNEYYTMIVWPTANRYWVPLFYKADVRDMKQIPALLLALKRIPL